MMRSLLTFACVLVTAPRVLGVPGPQTNTKLFTGNQALDSGALGFGLGVGAAVIGSGLINGAAISNPCGKTLTRPVLLKVNPALSSKKSLLMTKTVIKRRFKDGHGK